MGVEQFTDGWIPRRWPPCVEEIDDRVAEAYRRMTTAERGRRVFEMWEFARQVAEAAERRRNPGISDGDLRRRVAKRMSGDDPD